MLTLEQAREGAKRDRWGGPGIPRSTMAIVRAPDDRTGEDTYEYCPALFVETLYGILLNAGIAEIVEYID
jgi:hypothetical protein